MEQSQLSAHLAAAPLLSTLSPDARASAIQRFVARPFVKGQSLLRAGDQGRALGLLLTGSALIQARRDDRAFTVEVLEPGQLFGELAFFDPASARTADVIGSADGVAAMLSYTAYEAMLAEGDPAVEQIEKAVLELVGNRIQATSARMAELLQANQRGDLFSTIRRLFGLRG
jgi:CRP/FNR family transcriptional regulator